MPIKKYYGAKIEKNTTGWPSNTQGQTEMRTTYRLET